jgi:phosphomannomutase|tara:strand:+ start:756 stop:1466 length:711 start_codon:yes stop_codon:yes gene_type:complete
MNKFIFDVDGTLTPSRQRIDAKFEEWFYQFCCDNEVYLVTGSDYPKTVEQLGERIVHRVKAVYNCSGNDVWSHGENIKRNNWTMLDELRKLCESWLHVSKFPLRTGLHLEERPGTVNFSIVGRNATMKERQLYVAHDEVYRERESIALQINMIFEDVTAKIGGDTGIDIYPTGYDKGQIINDFNLKEDRLYFFGDKTLPGGNDEPLAKLIKHSYQVKGWQDTYERLAYLQEAKITA